MENQVENCENSSKNPILWGENPKLQKTTKSYKNNLKKTKSPNSCCGGEFSFIPSQNSNFTSQNLYFTSQNLHFTSQNLHFTSQNLHFTSQNLYFTSQDSLCDVIEVTVTSQGLNQHFIR